MNDLLTSEFKKIGMIHTSKGKANEKGKCFCKIFFQKWGRGKQEAKNSMQEMSLRHLLG